MESIGERTAALKQQISDGALNAIRPLLPEALVAGGCQANRYKWRERLLSPLLLLLSCTFKQLKSGTRARDVEDWWMQWAGAREHQRDGKRCCAARARLPIRVFQSAYRQVGAAAARWGGYKVGGLDVLSVDGATVKAPRSDANCAAFGVQRNQHGAGGPPVLRLALVVCAGRGAVLDSAWCPHRFGEVRLLGQLLLRLRPDSLLRGDTLLGTYLTFSLLRQRGAHGLFPRQISRKDNVMRRLGRGDAIHLWRKPTHAGLFPHLLAGAPETLEIRVVKTQVARKGYRTRTLILSTTLLDPKRYPAAWLAEEYCKRYGIEFDLRALKTEHGLDALTAKSPGVVCRELYSILLAYNAVRATMAQAAARVGISVRRLSYERSKEMLGHACAQRSLAPTWRLPQLFEQLLQQVSTAVQPQQARPPEPRALVDNKRRYPLLRIARAQWRRKRQVA